MIANPVHLAPPHAPPYDRWGAGPGGCQCYNCRDFASRNVALETFEVDWADDIAQQRHDNARGDKRHRRGAAPEDKGTALAMDRLGALGELGVARLLNVPWEPSTQPDREDGDVVGCEVKAREALYPVTWWNAPPLPKNIAPEDRQRRARHPLIAVKVALEPTPAVEVVGWKWLGSVYALPVTRPAMMRNEAHWFNDDEPFLDPWYKLVLGLQQTRIIARRNYRALP